MNAQSIKEPTVASADQRVRIKEALQSLPAVGEQKSTLNQLQAAVGKNDESSVKELATKYLFKTMDSRRKSTLTEAEWRMIFHMADKEKVAKELKKTGNIETASSTIIDITAIDFGPGAADASLKPPVSKDSPTTSKKIKAEEQGQLSRNIEKISQDRRQELDEKNKDINQLEQKFREAERMVRQKQEDLEVRNRRITDLEHQLQAGMKREKEGTDEITRINKAHSNEKAKLNGEIKSRQDIVTDMEKNLENLNLENTTLQKKIERAEKKSKENEKEYSKAFEKILKENKVKIDSLLEHHAQEIAGKNRQLQELALERDDMRNRFSKLAGDKLTDQNADIADLSDPNRAMKLSEKFGQLYDDEWTDAFEVLKGKKMSVKDAIQFLLDILQRCVAFCAKLRDTQMDSLKNVLLHPSQDVSMFLSEPRKHGQKDRPRMSSKDEKATLALRRQICMQENILDEVKQVFVKETKSSDKTGYNKKHLELCTPYLHKCAEICWSMVIHDPPLYIKFDAKAGDKLDLNFYTVYASTGEKIDFLVWPPLFNEEKGALLSKGVAEPLKK